MSLARVFPHVGCFTVSERLFALITCLFFGLVLQGCGSPEKKNTETSLTQKKLENQPKENSALVSAEASSNTTGNHVPNFLPLAGQNPSPLSQSIADSLQNNQVLSNRSNPFRQTPNGLPPLQSVNALGTTGHQSIPTPSGNDPKKIAQVNFQQEVDQNSQRMVPSVNPTNLSDEKLLDHDPAQWLKRKSDLAGKYSRELNAKAEYQVWSEIQEAIEQNRITLPWVKTTIVLNKKNAEKKIGWSAAEKDAWKGFLSLESELMKMRVNVNTLKRQGQSETESYQKQIQAISQKLQLQLALLQKVSFGDTYLAANVFEQASRASYAQKKYSNALGLAKQSFVIRQKVLGLHPDTVTVLQLCGKISEDFGRGKEAIDYYFNAVNLARKVWGPDHLTTALIADQFGLFILNHYSQKPNPTPEDFEFAKVWLEEAVRIRSKELEADNLLLAISQRNLGRLETVLADLKKTNPGLHRQSADLCYQAAYNALQKNSISEKDWNNFLLEFSAVKASLGQNAAAEQMLGQVAKNLQKPELQKSLTTSRADVFYRWAITCLRQKQPERINVGKQRLLQAKQLANTDSRSNTPTFFKRVDGALARVAEVERENR